MTAEVPDRTAAVLVNFLQQRHPYLLHLMAEKGYDVGSLLQAHERISTGIPEPRRPITPGLLTVNQAASELDRPERTIRQWLTTGRLIGWQDGSRGSWSVDAESVAALASRKPLP